MRISGILTISALLAGLTACQPEKDASYTLVQYNVGAFSKYEDSGVDAIRRAVVEMNADAVTLNEVDSCTARTGKVDQLAAFAEAMGEWNHYYAAAMPYKGGAYGVGVASKPSLEVLRTDRIALPQLDGREPRAVAVVEFEDFVLASTHLDLTLESQLGQVKVINHYMDSLYADSGKPVFLGGDFNCEPDSEPIALMEQTWKLITPVTFSYPSDKPCKCIDFIFVRAHGRELDVEYSEIPVSLESADLATASDHLPVVMKVKIKK